MAIYLGTYSRVEVNSISKASEEIFYSFAVLECGVQ